MFRALTEKEWSKAESPLQLPHIECRPELLPKKSFRIVKESRPARAARYSEALMIVGAMRAPG